MKEGIGTVVLLQAMDKSLQTGMPIKVSALLEEFNLTETTIFNNNTI
jgi:hypothetical protein